MADKQKLITYIVSVMSKITEHKLTGTNYLEWSKAIKIFAIVKHL